MKAIELEKAYNPKSFEDRVYKDWEESGSFKPLSDKNPQEAAGRPNFTVVIPPPNVTGVLHMGHGLNNTLQDIVVRYHRMKGDNTLWLPGTDHAGIATQNVVERRLKKEGLRRQDLGRDKFLEKTWEVKREHHSIISNQQRRLGNSVDWSRERFTLDEGLSKAVREVFVTLYERNLIYRGNYLVNWCPSCGTALADDEVEHEDTAGAMYHMYYEIADGSSIPAVTLEDGTVFPGGNRIEIATTRPETLFGDTAVAVHPDDPRYKALVGKKVRLALTDREIPVVADSYVDRAFGTGVVKLPGLNVGRTGLTEAQAKEAGYDVITALVPTDDKAHYYPDASFFITKVIADKTTRKLLGVQVFGPGEVDKMVDIAVMGINMDAKLDDFENADFAYAPPFSTAIHPFVQAVYVLMNKIDGTFVSMTPAEYAAGAAKGYRVVDVQPEPGIRGAFFVNLAQVNGEVEGLGKDEKLLLVCAKGKRAYFLQNRMRYYGYKNTVVLEGATFFNDVKVENAEGAVSKEEETRVKALGFLKDKRTPDKFNGRVITRNGKITADEARVIAEAAEKFGSGEVTMTSRLTMEIQGVPFDNIEPLREYLMQAGLETGGTGSKVRPVVSCKGTTCQYGLIDTFALSEEVHERFYHGYREVKLPHKFKIAVGGCPNNCVKPDLNDLGIIGQRVPQIDLEKCRGCKVCQIENNCPIGVAKMADGKITIDENACNHCGRCVGKCPFHAVEDYTNGYRVYIGGRWGKKVAQGRYLDKVFTDKDEVLEIVEKAILLFREQGITGERFADTVARLGFENVQEQLLSNDLLSRKEENLKAQKHLKGGATC